VSNRADNFSGTFPTPSDAGSSWSGNGTWANSAGVCALSSTGVNDNPQVLEASSALGRASVKLAATSSSGQAWLVLRFSSTSNYVYCSIDKGGFAELLKNVAGTPTHLAYTGTITVADGDVFSLEVDGSNVYVLKQNGSTVAWASGTGTDSFSSAATKHGFGQFGGGAWHFDDFSFTDTSTPAGSFTVSPTTVPKSHSGHITLTLTGTSTTWAGGGSEFSLSGVAGVTKVSENVTSTTAATLVITTGATAGTLTVTDLDSLTATTTVAAATLAISPTSGLTGATPTLTLTGTSTVWGQETAAGLFTVSGGTGASVGTPTVTTDTAGTAVLTVGSGAGTLTVTDASTGATATFTATDPSALYNVVLLGDSRTFGTAASDAAHRYPARTAAILDSRFYTANVSAGTSGRSLDAPSGDDLRTDLAGTSAGGGSPDVPGYYDASFAANLLVVWGGFNDWNNDNTLTAAQLYTRLSALVSDGVAAGWKVVVCAETSSQDAGWDAKMASLNALARDQSTGVRSLGAVAIVDRDQMLSAAGAYSNAYFSGGGPHLTDAGQERLAVGTAAVLTQYADGFTPGAAGGGGLLQVGGMTGGSQQS
jgi:hypothetical protein